jgi:hypothetical protein
MAARAAGVAGDDDCANAVHVLTTATLVKYTDTPPEPILHSAAIHYSRSRRRAPVLLTISRGILGFVGAIALVFGVANLVTGGVPIGDPVLPSGLAFGALTLGAALWTTAPERWRALVVWLGVIAVGVAIAVFVVNFGEAALRDVLIYFGIPAAIVALAAIGVAIGRLRAGPFGT